MKTIIIPFDGFYESVTMAFIEQDIESENQYRQENNLPLISDWQVVIGGFSTVAKEWVRVYKQWLKSEFDLELESLSFESLSMPKAYNFDTDIIFCNISDVDILKIHSFALKNHLDYATVKDKFGSRDGFHSFYDEFLTDWNTKPVLDWDHNELSILFPEFDSNGEPLNYFELWENDLCNGFFYEIVEFVE